jgi:hypothetical protein
MARRAHASFTKFQALVGAWDQGTESAYYQPHEGLSLRRVLPAGFRTRPIMAFLLAMR